MGWVWRDPTCQFIGRDRILRGDLEWGDALDPLQVGLDVVGMVPGFGEPADFINGGISLLRGDRVGAARSFGSMVPFAGWGATVAKWGRRGMRLGDAGRGVRQAPAVARGLGAVPGGQMPGHAAVPPTLAATVGMFRWAPNGVPGGGSGGTQGVELFYRAVSSKELTRITENGWTRLSLKGTRSGQRELFVSPSLAYVARFAAGAKRGDYDHLLEIHTRPGTTNALRQLNETVTTGRSPVHFKWEKGTENIGLRAESIDFFNQHILFIREISP